jgi:hypothetical protein
MDGSGLSRVDEVTELAQTLLRYDSMRSSGDRDSYLALGTMAVAGKDHDFISVVSVVLHFLPSARGGDFELNL